jgi:hypothetical protein
VCEYKGALAQPAKKKMATINKSDKAKYFLKINML